MPDPLDPLTADLAHTNPAAAEEAQPITLIAPAASTPAASAPMVGAPTAARRPSLWRHADYMKIWTAATISLMGSAITQMAVPFIAAVILNATPFEVALVGTVEMLPFLLFTLPAGAWLDRVRRRPVLIAGDFGRAIALATIPLAYAAGVLTIWQLYVVGFTTGIFTVFFDVADQSYLPVLLEPEDLVEGNAKLQIPGSAAQIVGPGLAGSLIGLVAAPFTIVLDALSFVASGSLIWLVRKPESKPARKVDDDGNSTSFRQEIVDGLRYVLGNPYLRMIAGSTGTFNLGSSIVWSIFAVFAYRELGLQPALVGLALGLGGTGILAGAFVSAPLARRFGVGPAIVVSDLIGGLSALLMALLTSSPGPAFALLFVAQFVGGLTTVVYNVNQVSFRQAITPLDMQGRMNATMRFIVWGTMPVGGILGGLIASFLPLRTTVLIGGGVQIAAFLWVLLSPVRSLREIPQTRGTQTKG